MKVWWIDKNKLGIGSYDGTNVTKLDSAKTVRIHFTKKETSITDLPADYHEGVVARVIEKLAVKGDDFNKAQYYNSQWTNAVSQGKKEAHMGKDGSSINVMRYDY